jgi:hypothetical protein
MTSSDGPAIIGHLNDVPEWLIRKARGLSDADAARRLLMAHTMPGCWSALPPFVDDVVVGGQPAGSWLRGQVIVPDFSLAEVVTLRYDALWAPIGGPPSRRVVPALEDWPGAGSWVAAPARVLPEADYRFTPSANATALGPVATEAVTDAAVAMGRWVAARLALAVPAGRAVRSIGDLAAAPSPLPVLAHWTRSARRAAAGLVREYRDLGPPSNSIPGLRGPDDWYV